MCFRYAKMVYLKHIGILTIIEKITDKIVTCI